MERDQLEVAVKMWWPGSLWAKLRPMNRATLFHITHWKAGSQWIRRILEQLFPEAVVEPQVDQAQFLSEPIRKGMIYPTCYLTREEFLGRDKPDGFKYFVVMRDLRDTLVSGYFSLRISHSVLVPLHSEWRRNLESMGTEDGLIYLMREWLPYSEKIQKSWIEGGERVLRYEDFLQRDVEILDEELNIRGGLDIERNRLKEVVIANRFECATHGRKRGDEDVTSHNRKGISGDWRNHFSSRVRSAFKELYGNLLIATGYETDSNW